MLQDLEMALGSELCWVNVQVPVLGFFAQAATAAKEAAMGIYVQQQLEYGKLWKLVEFSQVPGPSCSLSLSIVIVMHMGSRHP